MYAEYAPIYSNTNTIVVFEEGTYNVPLTELHWPNEREPKRLTDFSDGVLLGRYMNKIVESDGKKFLLVEITYEHPLYGGFLGIGTNWQSVTFTLYVNEAQIIALPPDQEAKADKEAEKVKKDQKVKDLLGENKPPPEGPPPKGYTLYIVGGVLLMVVGLVVYTLNNRRKNAAVATMAAVAVSKPTR